MSCGFSFVVFSMLISLLSICLFTFICKHIRKQRLSIAWQLRPPETFSLLTNKNGASLKTFWIVFHSIHELTFILAIIFCWKIIPIRNGLLILFAIHFAVRVWTLSYFAPNIIEFQKIADGLSSATDLLNRANMWKMLNYVRVGLFIAVSIGLVPLLVKLLNLKTN